MDSMEDHFGELYADVEVQVNSTSNAPQFTGMYTEPEPDDKDECNGNRNNKIPSLNPLLEENSVTESTRRASTIERDDVGDSEDDMKIVLNDEDCKKFPAVAGSSGGFDEDVDGFNHMVCDGLEFNSNNKIRGYNFQYSKYKYMRSRRSTFPSNLRVNGSVGIASFSSMSAKGDWEYNGCNQHMGSNAVQVASIHATANLVVPQGAYGFSLPWYRTIMDINIDSFREKLWRHPRANTSDFFNFGFDEDSWKRYCSSLAYEVGSDHGKVVQEAKAEDITHVRSSPKFSDRGERPLELPKGRAIKVEGSIGERQPSVKRRRIQDSDVVIQIKVHDSAEDYSGSGKENLGLIDSNSSDHETSKNGDLEQDFNGDVHCCGGTTEDGPSADSLEKDTRNLDVAYSSRRCTEPMSVCNEMSLDSDDHGHGKVSDWDRYHHQKMKVCTSKEISEAMETFNKADKVAACKSNSWLMEAELSLGDRSHFSLSPTCSGSDSKDSVHCDPVKICSQLRRLSLNLGTELQDSVRSDHKNNIKNGIKTKQGDRKYYLRRRSPKFEDQKHHSGRHCGVTEQRIYPESDGDTSRISNGKDDNKNYIRHGPVRAKWKHCRGMFHSASEQKICPRNSDNAFLVSVAEGIYYRDYRSVDFGRQKERLRDLDHFDEEDFSYYKETGSSSGYCSDRPGDGHISAVNEKHFCRKYHHIFGDQIDPHVRRKWDEREYCHEISSRVYNEDEISRNQYHYKRGCSHKEMNFLAREESRWLVPKYSSTLKTKWRSKSDKLRFGKRIDHDGGLIDYSQEDNFMQEKCESFSFFDRKRDDLDSMYEGDLPFSKRELKTSVQMERYGDSKGIKSGYRRHANHQSSIFRSYRECYTANEGRWHDTGSSIDEVYESGLPGRYGRHKRHIYGRENGWFGIYENTDDTKNSIVDNNDPVDLVRTRSWLSEKLHRVEDEFIARDWDDELLAEKESFSYAETSIREKIRAKYESVINGELIGDSQLKRHRYELSGEGSSAKCRNYNIIYGGEDDHPFPRCRDSLDLFVGEGKPSGRRSNGMSLVRNGRFGKIDPKLAAKELRTSEDFHESNRGRAFRSDISKLESSENNKNWLDKFLVAEHNEDLDIEEGQIIMEEPKAENLSEKKHVSERVTPTCNACSGNASSENKIVREIDDQHILETLARMEKRRERFKDSIAPKQELEKNPKPQDNMMVKTAETKQQRPTQKRLWFGS